MEIIRLLINAGADLEKPDNFGSTPLHLACIYGHLNCVRILCELVGVYYCSIQVRCKILFKECNVLYFYEKLKKKLSKHFNSKFLFCAQTTAACYIRSFIRSVNTIFNVFECNIV